MGVVNLFNHKDAWQDALMAKKRLWHYGLRKSVPGESEDFWQHTIVSTRAFQTDQTGRPKNKS